MSSLRTILCVLLLAAAAYGVDCPYADTQWQQLRPARQRKELDIADTHGLDPLCVVALLERVSGSPEQGLGPGRAMTLLADHARMGRAIPYELLTAGIRFCAPEQHAAQWETVCRQWEREHGTLKERALALYGEGKLGMADTMHLALARAGMLSTSQYLQWETILSTRRAYDGLGRAMCMMGVQEPRLITLSRSHLGRQVADMDTAQVRQMLEAYADCFLASAEADTGALRDWLANTYARAKLYGAELRTLVELDAPNRPVLQTLVRVARRHYALKRFSFAARTALEAWSRTENRELRQLCATIAYESYRHLGLRDSAEVWLERTDMAAAGAAHRAVVFYQAHGQLVKADSLLAGIPPGVMADTLMVRQRLYEGRIGDARTVVANMASHDWWRRQPEYLRLWQVRVSLFSGAISLMSQNLDSLTFEPSWEHAAEVLRYRYWHQRIRQDPSALDVWGPFERALYCGNPQLADSLMRGASLKGTPAQLYRVRLVRGYLEKGDLVRAAAAAGSVKPKDTPPEQVYYCAEVLHAQGDDAKARELLEGLIMHHPESIYSSKARALLARVQS